MRPITFFRRGAAFSNADVVAGWCGDENFRRFVIGVLADALTDAKFWETPPVTRAGQDRAFE